MAQEGLAQLVAQLRQIGGAAADVLTALSGRIDALERDLREQSRQNRLLWEMITLIAHNPRLDGERDATELEAVVGDLRRQMGEHDARITALSRARTAERLTPGSYLLHQDLSRRFRTLAQQDLLDVSVQAGPRTPKAEAEIRAMIAHVLFDKETADIGADEAYLKVHGAGARVPLERFGSLWDTAHRLRRDAAASGHQVEWDFDATAGAAVDEARQEAFPGCEPTAPIAFVVAPAYVVDQKIYARQLVFTEEDARAEPRIAAPPWTGDRLPEAEDQDAAVDQ